MTYMTTEIRGLGSVSAKESLDEFLQILAEKGHQLISVQKIVVMNSYLVCWEEED